MKAMILAAGRGNRLQPLTQETPKPLLPIKGKPLIQWQLEALATTGFDEVVINVHHLADQIVSFVGDGSRFGLRVLFSREADLLETGGGIVKALPLLGDEPFLLLNGDIFSDFDFTTLESPSSLAHLVLVPKPEYRERGDFELEGNRIVARGDSWVYGGIARLSPRLFDGAPQAPFSWTVDLLFGLIGKTDITAQTYRGVWSDIGTPAQYDAIK